MSKLLGDFNKRVFSKGGFLGLSGLGRLLVYPLGLFTLKTFYFKFPFGLSTRIKLSILFRLGKVGLWVSQGFGWLLVYPLG